MTLIKYTILIACLLGGTLLHGQSADIKTSKGQKVGTTVRLDQLSLHTNASTVKAKALKKSMPQIPNFPNRPKGRQQTIHPNPLPQFADPVLQKSSLEKRSVPVMPELILDGLGSETSPFVPDPTLAKGPNHLVQIINASNMMIWDNQGNRLLNTPLPLSSIWQPLDRANGGDPIVLYDVEVDRWIITEFARPFSPFVFIAVSRTPDPMGSFDVYEFGTFSFPDYPKYSIWHNALLFTANETGNLPVYAINKQQLYAGADEVDLIRASIPRLTDATGFQTWAPVSRVGASSIGATTDPMIMRLIDDSWVADGVDHLEIHTLEINWDFPTLSTLTLTDFIPTAPFESDFCARSSIFGFDCVPQPGTDIGLDGIDNTLMNQIQYRRFGSSESIVLCHTVDARLDNVGGIRWYELTREAGQSSWSIKQQSTYAPDDALNRFVPSISIDASGNIGLAFAVASSEKSASLRFTGRNADDDLNRMTIEEQEVFTGDGFLDDDRFGDYAHMTIDAADDHTFWFTGEYCRQPQAYGTGIFSFSLDRQQIDLSPIQVISPSLYTLDTVTSLIVAVRNNGLDTIRSFTTSFGLMHMMPRESITTTRPLAPNDTMWISFLTDIQLLDFNPLDIQIVTSNASDLYNANDTLIHTVTRLPAIDLSADILPLSTLCGKEPTLDVEVFNFGFQQVDSFALHVLIENLDTTVMSISSAISAKSKRLISIPIPSNTLDTIRVEVEAISLAQMDLINTNNLDQVTLPVQRDGSEIHFRLDLDEYPDENSVRLIDEDNIQVFDVTTFDDPLAFQRLECLPSGCYTLIIEDSFGDGIFNSPSLVITNLTLGIVIADLEGLDFTDRFVYDFCINSPAQCNANILIEAIDESSSSAEDGVIRFYLPPTVSNPRFSIDGGVTFQLDSQFINLPAGRYETVITDDLECTYLDTIELTSCGVSVEVDIQNVTTTGAMDGIITIIADSMRFPLFVLSDTLIQTSPTFEGLSAGTYKLLVLYGNTCLEKLDSLVIRQTSSTNDLGYGGSIRILPNPSEGYFRLEILGDRRTPILPFTIYSIDGKPVFSDRLPRYDNAYVGDINIQHLPDGLYLLRVSNGLGAYQVVRILKI